MPDTPTTTQDRTFAGRRPGGLLAAPAYFGPLTVCGLAGRAGSAGRLAAEVALLGLLVAVVSFESTVPAGLLAVGSSVLSLNGFAENGLGVLDLHLQVDGPVLLSLLAVCVLARAAVGGSDHVYEEGVA